MIYIKIGALEITISPLALLILIGLI